MHSLIKNSSDNILYIRTRSHFSVFYFKRTHEIEEYINIFCEPKKILCYGFSATYNNNNDDDKQKFYSLYHSYNYYYDCIEKNYYFVLCIH